MNSKDLDLIVDELFLKNEKISLRQLKSLVFNYLNSLFKKEKNRS
jgi:hypothetical protein